MNGRDPVNAQIADENRRSGTHNLQTNHSHHPKVGDIIQHSVNNWLTGPQVYRILRQRRTLTVSGDEDPHRGITGLYLFYCPRFFNYRNGLLSTRRTNLTHRQHNISATSSVPADPITLTYSRRLYRCSSSLDTFC